MLQGTLALLVLKTLASSKRLHGYAITAHIQRVSEDLLRVEEGSLYPALHRMEQMVAAVGVGADREEPRGPLLLADREGTPAARARAGELDPPDRRRGAGAAVRLRENVMSWLRRLLNTCGPGGSSGRSGASWSSTWRNGRTSCAPPGSERRGGRAARAVKLGNPLVQAERTRDMDIAVWADGGARNLRHAARAWGGRRGSR